MVRQESSESLTVDFGREFDGRSLRPYERMARSGPSGWMDDRNCVCPHLTKFVVKPRFLFDVDLVVWDYYKQIFTIGKRVT